MTLEEAKNLKKNQVIYYRGLEDFPEKVTVSDIRMNQNNRIEVHLADNCYIPEGDLNYIFLTFDECANDCERIFKEKLNKLKQMIIKEK